MSFPSRSFFSNWKYDTRENDFSSRRIEASPSKSWYFPESRYRWFPSARPQINPIRSISGKLRFLDVPPICPSSRSLLVETRFSSRSYLGHRLSRKTIDYAKNVGLPAKSFFRSDRIFDYIPFPTRNISSSFRSIDRQISVD